VAMCVFARRRLPHARPVASRCRRKRARADPSVQRLAGDCGQGTAALSC
jgi:hypothetical protein